MTTPAVQSWFAFHITLKHMTSGASLVLRFSNRMPTGETTVIYYPLLKSISGLGLALGQNGMPAASSGTVTIKDPFSSIGEELRVFDLLQEYTGVNQAVEFYDARTTLSDTSPYADMVLRWSGVCKSITKGFSDGDQTLTFNVQSQTIPQKAISASIDDTNLLSPAVTPAATVVEGARGKAVPFVFGQGTVNIPGIQYRVDSASAYAFASATRGLDPQETTGDLNHIYVKDSKGVFRNAYVFNTAIEEGHVFARAGAEGGASTPEAVDGSIEYCYPFQAKWIVPFSSEDGVIVSGGQWRFRGLNNGGLTPIGNLVFSIYALGTYDPGQYYIPIEPALATVEVPKSAYLSLVRGASDFWVYFQFPEAFYMPRTTFPSGVYGYAVGIKQSAFATTATDFVFGNCNKDAGTFLYGYRDVAMKSGWNFPGALAVPPCFKVFCLSASWGTDTSSGRNIRKYQFKQYPDVVRSAYATQINVELMARTKGAADTSGYIPATDDLGTKCITRPDHVAAAMTGDWTGSAFAKSTKWDFDAFSTTCNTVFATSHPFNRRVNGFIEGRQTQDAYLRALCSETACKIAQRRSGKFALWPWGTTGTVTKVFTDEDILSLNSWERLDSSSVVNRAQLFGGKGYLNVNQEVANAQDTFANYSLSQMRDSTTSAYDTFLCGTSTTLYGSSELDQVETDLLGDTQSLNTLAEYYLRVHDHPHTVTSFDVNYYDNNTLELLDIVELLSAMLPASGGSSLSGREATYTAEEVLAHNGQYVIRAQRYRAQLVGWTINWSQGSLPTLTLEARIIKPYHANDPT